MDTYPQRPAQIRRPPALNELISCVVAAGVATAAWWALLAWNANGTSVGHDGVIHGYPRPWQYVATLVVAGLLGVWLGHRRSLFAAPAAAGAAYMVSSGYTLVTAEYPYGDPLNGVAAVMLGFYSFGGLVLVAAITKVAEDAVGRSKARRCGLTTTFRSDR